MRDSLTIQRGAREEQLWESALAARRHERAASHAQGFGVLPEHGGDSVPSFRLGWSRTGQCLGLLPVLLWNTTHTCRVTPYFYWPDVRVTISTQRK